MERVIWNQIKAEVVINNEEEAEADNTLLDAGFHSNNARDGEATLKNVQN